MIFDLFLRVRPPKWGRRPPKWARRAKRAAGAGHSRLSAAPGGRPGPPWGPMRPWEAPGDSWGPVGPAALRCRVARSVIYTCPPAARGSDLGCVSVCESGPAVPPDFPGTARASRASRAAPRGLCGSHREAVWQPQRSGPGRFGSTFRPEFKNQGFDVIFDSTNHHFFVENVQKSSKNSNGPHIGQPEVVCGARPETPGPRPETPGPRPKVAVLIDAAAVTVAAAAVAAETPRPWPETPGPWPETHWP